MSKISNVERRARRGVENTRVLGVAISGAKADRTCLVVLDHFAGEKRLFVRGVFDRIKSEEHVSADLKVHELIQQFSESCAAVAFDAPLNLPPCIDCKLKCPGAEVCNVESVKWMRSVYQAQEKAKPKKYFSPYTQRPVDLCLTNLDSEHHEVHQALGANLAPLTARAMFISRRINVPAVEVSTRVSVWRLGLTWGLNKSQLRSYRASVGGDEARKIILKAMTEKLGLFVYEQDQRILIESFHAFDALIAAYLGILNVQGKVEKAPKTFPKKAAWVLLPKS